MKSILSLSVLLALLPSSLAGDWSLVPGSPEPPEPWGMLGDCEETTKPPPKSAASLPTHRAVLVFTATWCGPCQQMKRTTYPQLIARGWRISQVDDPAAAKAPHVVLVDVDKHDQLSRQLKITAYPTIISWDGQAVTRRVTGYVDPFGIGTAYTASAPKPEQPAAAARQYRERWTFPGDTRADLIGHLSGSNHNYTAASLRRMSTDDLYRLHDSDHNKASRKPARILFPFIQGPPPGEVRRIGGTK